MDADLLKIGLQVVNMAGTVWLLLERRNDKTNDRITELSAKVSELDKDVAALEASGRVAPNHDDLGKVHESINKLSTTVHELVGETRGQSANLRLILNRITEKGMP